MRFTEIIFFLLIFFLFYLAVKSDRYLEGKTGLNREILLLFIALVYTLAVIGIFVLAKPGKTKDNYQMLNLSKKALCKGGPFMHQGDSPQAKMCQDFFKTPEGQCSSCATGEIGVPRNPFVFTPDSNDNWENVRCKKYQSCHACAL